MPSETAGGALYHDVHWEIDYKVRLGVAWTRFMHGLEQKQLWATTCTRCDRTFVPPQSYCEHCYEAVNEWLQVEPVGTLGASTIVYQGFQGGPEAPYAVGAINIDGTDTQLMHFIGGIDLGQQDQARKELYAGRRVHAVWAERRAPNILAIKHFTVDD